MTNLFKCPYCAFESESESGVQVHWGVHAGADPEIFCWHCGGIFRDDPTCMRHIQRVHPAEYKDDYPDMRLIRPDKCNAGHPFDGVDTRGWRTCSTCRRAARQRWRDRRREKNSSNQSGGTLPGAMPADW